MGIMSRQAVLKAAAFTTLSLSGANIQAALIDPLTGMPVPDDVNLKAWFRADAGVIADANGVVEWVDQSVSVPSANRNLAPPALTAAGQPDLLPAVPGLANRPAINFDGVQNVLRRPTGNAPVTGNTDRTVFVVTSDVQQRPSTNQIEHVLHFGNNAADQAYGVLVAHNSNHRRIGNHYWSGFDPGNIPSGPSSRLINFVYDGDAVGGSTGLDQFFVNGYFGGQRDILAANTAVGGRLNTGANEFVVGSRIALASGVSPVEHMKGNVAEIIIYDQALDATQRQQVSSYLASKYNIPLAGAAPAAPAFNYPDFSDTSQLTLSGGTIKTVNDVAEGVPVARLTDNVNNQVGGLMRTRPVTLASDQSFDTTFSFRVGEGAGVDCCGDSPGADGLSFVIHQDPRGPLAVGEAGGAMGIAGAVVANQARAGISKGVVVEFDTWHSGSFDVGNTGINGNHIGVNILGAAATASIAQTGPTEIPPINDSQVKTARVVYDGKTRTMSIFYDNGIAANTLRLTKQVDLSKVLSGNDVFLGFTAATGGANNNHEVRSWSFSSTPSGSTPTPFTPTEFNFSDFSSLDVLQLNAAGTSPLPSSVNNRLRMTSGASQGTSAMLLVPVQMAPSYAFKTKFAVEITNPGGSSDVDGPGADGLTFVMHTDPRGTKAVGGSGGAMGLSGIANFVAVELDSWHAGSFDPAGNTNTNGTHIAIDASSSATSLAQTGPLPRFNDGGVRHVWVEYDGSMMNVFLSDTETQPSSPILSQIVDLGPIFGHARELFIGFTAGTGGAFQTHEVLSWNFAAIPEPSSLSLLGLGALGLIRRRRRA